MDGGCKLYMLGVNGNLQVSVIYLWLALLDVFFLFQDILTLVTVTDWEDRFRYNLHDSNNFYDHCAHISDNHIA